MAHEAAVSEPAVLLPQVPLTLEGSGVLHQFFRLRWPAWKALPSERKCELAGQAAALLEPWEQESRSALYSLLGHKGDLLFVHFRESFDDLNRAELQMAQLGLADFFEPTTSYLSVIELGLYDSSIKLFRSLAERGIEPHTPPWDQEVAATIEVQRKAMHPRLYPRIPDHRYICFYPMDRRRGEAQNFYTVPITDRGRMMREHGLVGRRYSDHVQQIITGSMGFDDWEWGVDLFAPDPLVFKKLIYEMRFDEVSAIYALFGPFYIGLRIPAAGLPTLIHL